MTTLDHEGMPIVNNDLCPCGSGLYKTPLMDAQNIFCCFVCDLCEEDKKARYRPEIFTGYDQSDVDGPIEPEEPDMPGGLW